MSTRCSDLENAHDWLIVWLYTCSRTSNGNFSNLDSLRSFGSWYGVELSAVSWVTCLRRYRNGRGVSKPESSVINGRCMGIGNS
jgi:hypothetical protein